MIIGECPYDDCDEDMWNPNGMPWIPGKVMFIDSGSACIAEALERIAAALEKIANEHKS